MQKLSFTITSERDVDTIFLSGSIYEGSGKILQPLLSITTSRAIFNFRSVAHTNTCGIQEWVEFLQEFNKDRQVILAECPSSIVMLINMIPIFKGDASVESVSRSYYCEKCAKERFLLYRKGQNLPTQADLSTTQKRLDEALCDTCKSTMGAEIPAEEFFAFVLNDEP